MPTTAPRWYDLTLATPLIGVRYRPRYEILTRAREVIAPILDRLTTDNEAAAFGDLGQSWGVEIKTQRGVNYSLTNNDLITSVAYTISHIPQPGKLPLIQIDELQPYSTMLDRCVGAAQELATALIDYDDKGIDVQRIGVILNAQFPHDENQPPGVEKLVASLAEPWPMRLEKFSSQVLVNLDERDHRTDRCHYTMRLDRTAKTPQLDFILDWQTLFTQPQTVKSTQSWSELLRETTERALQHFTKVGRDGIPSSDE